MNESRLDALADRVRELERENGRLKWFGSAALLVVLALMGVGAIRAEGRQDRSEKVIRAERFLAVDERGRELLAIGTSVAEKGNGTIEFLDRSGKRCMSLGLGADDTPFVLLTRRDGRDELALEMRPGMGMAVSLRDRKRDSGLLLGTSPEGVAALGFMGEGGTAILQMGVNPDGSSALIFRDKDGKEILRIPPG
jgi:hypothetical protein